MTWNDNNMINEPLGEWGGPWTEKKLEAFSKYVTEEPLVLNNRNGVPLFHFVFASNNEYNTELPF